jgi:hypothetical protein
VTTEWPDGEPDPEVCAICGAPDPSVRPGLVHWADESRGLGGWESVPRCADREHCRGRLQVRGVAWPAVEGRGDPFGRDDVQPAPSIPSAQRRAAYDAWAARQPDFMLDRSVPADPAKPVAAPPGTSPGPAGPATDDDEAVTSWW